MNTTYGVLGEVRSPLRCMEGFWRITQEWTELRRGGTMDWARRAEVQTRQGQADAKKGRLFLLSLQLMNQPLSQHGVTGAPLMRRTALMLAPQKRSVGTPAFPTCSRLVPGIPLKRTETDSLVRSL